MNLDDRFSLLRHGGFAVLRSGYSHLLLLPISGLTLLCGTVLFPCTEIPREPFECFGSNLDLKDWMDWQIAIILNELDEKRGKRKGNGPLISKLLVF